MAFYTIPTTLTTPGSDLLIALQEKYLRIRLGLEQIPSDRSISRGHEDIHPQVIKRAYRPWARELQRQGQMPGWLIAIDSTFLIVYGKTYQRDSYSLIRLFRRQVMGQAGWSNHAVGWLRRYLCQVAGCISLSPTHASIIQC